MPHVPGLRSSYEKVGRLVYVGRMFDKLRLQAKGVLPSDYQANLGRGFDSRACAFLGLSHEEVRARVAAGDSDEQILALAQKRHPRTDEECEVWNFFMIKRGWRDSSTPTLQQRIGEYGLTGKPIETWFDLNEFDEGRDPVAARAWDQV